MAKPLIGITTRNGKDPDGHPLTALQHSYINAIVQAGGLPILIPAILSEEDFLDLYFHLSGILFSGGGDVALEHFTGSSHPRIGEVDEKRDFTELSLMRVAVDDGKPMPGLVDKTIANLREIAPTIYFNVPRGFDMLLPALEQDAALRKTFFSRLQMIFYAAAALPQNLWQRLEVLSIQERGERVIMVSAWGATETAPMITTVHFPIERAGVIGLPAPGAELKLIPNANKMEMRVRGPNVTPGYWKRADLTSAAFDEEGFYMIGDAGRFADPADPTQGIEFDGRIAEDFKLLSGTWVHTSNVRISALSELAPVAQDIVVAGHDRHEIGFLIFPNAVACRALCADLPATAPLALVLSDVRVVERVRLGLQSLAAKGRGSSSFATRALLMQEPASIDAGEITDKGYINQRAVRTRRAELLLRLYADVPGSEVIVVGVAPDAEQHAAQT